MINGNKDNGLQLPETCPGKRLLALEEGSGRTQVHLEIRTQGRDFLLLVTGGEAHVGAVAVAAADHAQLMVVPGHKEGPLAAECAAAVAGAAGKTCAAVVGIHLDDATGEEIAAIVTNVRRALSAAVRQVFPAEEGDVGGHGKS